MARAEGKLGAGEFAKYHAIGNDYIVIDPSQLAFKLTPASIRHLCRRNLGIGADGVLALSRSRVADFGLRIFNPDGYEAEKSGNGVRIFARFLYDFGYTRRRTFSVETKGGVVRVELLLQHDRVHAVRAEMGSVSFISSEIPVRGSRREVVREPLEIALKTFRVTCLTIGNPHCVVFVPRLRVSELRRFGPLIERHHNFPNRINVQFARVHSPQLIEALIWERGAGETMASGSSACAVAAAARKLGLAARRVRVRMPGGALSIEVDADWNLTMTGPAQPVYRGRIMAQLAVANRIR